MNFDELSPKQIAKIELIVCNDALQEPMNKSIVADCDAGCGRRIFFPMNTPTRPPKICAKCAAWAAYPVGSA